MKLMLAILLSFIMITLHSKTKDIVIHSDMTFEEAIQGTKAPKDVINNIKLINVEYYNFDGKLCRGQLVIHKDLEKDVQEAFKIIRETRFPIEKCIPIVKYNWDDNASMADNNTSAFNYRFIANTTRLSNHSYGRAIDFNPFQNPAIYNSGKISPKGAKYDKNDKGTIKSDDKLTKHFKEKGWRWGGDWTSLKDYQHFDKPE
jgi:hypothetical protein